MSRRGVTVLGLAAAGGVGYYLYSAGGDPKVAQKQAEADVHRASAKIKSELPGRKDEVEAKGQEYAERARAGLQSAEKKGEEYARAAGNKVDAATAEAKSKLAEAQAKAEEYRLKTGKELNKAVDTFDKKVEEGAAKAKSGLSSWFGGK